MKILLLLLLLASPAIADDYLGSPCQDGTSCARYDDANRKFRTTSIILQEQGDTIDFNSCRVGPDNVNPPFPPEDLSPGSTILVIRAQAYENGDCRDRSQIAFREDGSIHFDTSGLFLTGGCDATQAQVKQWGGGAFCSDGVKLYWVTARRKRLIASGR